MKRLQTEFLSKDNEVTEENYYYFLGCLPPRMMVINGFLLGEPTDHNGKGEARYEAYFTDNGKYYYAGKSTLADFILWLVPNQSLLNCDNELEKIAWVEKAKNGEVMRIM